MAAPTSLFNHGPDPHNMFAIALLCFVPNPIMGLDKSRNWDFLVNVEAKNSGMGWTNLQIILQISVINPLLPPKPAGKEHSGPEQQPLSRIILPNSQHTYDQMKWMQQATNHPQEQHSSTDSGQKIDFGGKQSNSEEGNPVKLACST